ncbi:MAG TPA: hypothetical protein VG942_02560 [Hyphomonadaceae bacterium]|nr:hypothetical protein [Hyphomonadaceae bacterium]
MKPSLIVLLAAGAMIAASPALAKTSLAKGQQVCQAAAKAETPAPKSVRIDSDETRVTDDALNFVLKVQNADNSAATVACTVDRATGQATLKPAS